MMWILFVLVIVLAVALAVLEVRSRMKKRGAAPEEPPIDKADALLRLKQQYDRDEISDEEYFLERTRLLSDE